MTLVDSNIFMYAAGRAHPLKHRAGAFLEKVAEGTVQAAIDAEALLEILHRYRGLKRWKEGRVVYDTARVLFPEVLAVTGEVMDGARRLMDGTHLFDGSRCAARGRGGGHLRAGGKPCGEIGFRLIGHAAGANLFLVASEFPPCARAALQQVRLISIIRYR